MQGPGSTSPVVPVDVSLWRRALILVPLWAGAGWSFSHALWALANEPLAVRLVTAQNVRVEHLTGALYAALAGILVGAGIGVWRSVADRVVWPLSDVKSPWVPMLLVFWPSAVVVSVWFKQLVVWRGLVVVPAALVCLFGVYNTLKRVPESWARRMRPPLPVSASLIFATVLGLTYAGLMAARSIRLFHAFYTHYTDMGWYINALWNIAEVGWGRMWEISTDFGTRMHFSHILIPLGHVYHAVGTPERLLVAHAGIVGLAAIPLWWLSRQRLGGVWLPLAWVGALVMSAPIMGSLNFELHLLAWTVFGILMLLAALHAGWNWLAGVMMLLLLFTKEDVQLTVIVIALYDFLILGNHRRGGVLIAVSGLFILYTHGYWLPKHTAGVPQAVEQVSLFWGGHLPPGAESMRAKGLLIGVLTNPFHVWEMVLAWGKVAWFLILVLSTGGMALFAGRHWLLMLVSGGLMLLATNQNFWLFHTQYHFIPGTLFLVLGIEGTRNLLIRAGSRVPSPDTETETESVSSPSSAGQVRLAAGMVVLLGAFIALMGWGRVWTDDRPLWPKLAEADRLLAESLRYLKPEQGVCAQVTVGPHLSERRHITLFPQIEPQTSVIILRGDRSIYPLRDPQDYARKVNELTRGGEFEVWIREDQFMIFKRTSKR